MSDDERIRDAFMGVCVKYAKGLDQSVCVIVAAMPNGRVIWSEQRLSPEEWQKELDLLLERYAAPAFARIKSEFGSLNEMSKENGTT
jgi:hypothetical protein